MRLIRTFLTLVVGIVIGVFLANYWSASSWTMGRVPGISPSDQAAARERGAELTRAAGKAANELEGALSDGALTAKITSKLALDDHVNARAINVDTSASVVTLRGTVGSEAERERAVRLARETRGVTRVVDQLKVQAR
jgi:hyperosmotically inducible periplasmic protein